MDGLHRPHLENVPFYFAEACETACRVDDAHHDAVGTIQPTDFVLSGMRTSNVNNSYRVYVVAAGWI